MRQQVVGPAAVVTAGTAAPVGPEGRTAPAGDGPSRAGTPGWDEVRAAPPAATTPASTSRRKDAG